MGLMSRFFSNARKPEGTLGKAMVAKMNSGHAELAAWGSQFVDVAANARVLDIGCGGGANVRSYLMRCTDGRVDGIDYSEVSVAAARDLNDRAISDGRCRIEQANVQDLPFDDASYDLACAFETVYFWPDLAESFAEVLRVLAPGGRFMVVNESTGSDATSTYFAGIIDGMRLYSAKEIASLMEQTGFAETVVHERQDKPWVSIVGTKAEAEPAPGHAPVATTRLRDLGPDYRNWVPAGMATGFAAGAAGLGAGAAAAGALRAPKLVTAALGVAAVGCGTFAAWCAMARDRFSYGGARKLSKQIVEGTASYVQMPEGGTCLDVGCGSGALAIAVARRNPACEVVGVDRWGAEYASYSLELCQRNATAEGASNVRFEPADATALPFDDETFDAVTSNYVYHNVAGANRQKLLRETLRCLKKGGTFAIHDIMSPLRFGDMGQFCQSLLDEGFEDARIIATDDGLFMDKAEARMMMLTGSTLLVGKK